MYLFFDTETTGLAQWGRPPHHPEQPHLVQLGALVISDNVEIDQINELVKPEGWVVPDEAARVHGFTTERCLKEGLPLRDVLGRFTDMASRATYLVAHNSDFDHLVMRAAFHRAKLSDHVMNKRIICTMKPATDICKIPGKYGKNKWPKLEEAHEFFFGEKFEGAHDAMADVRACARVFFELLERKAINLGEQPKPKAKAQKNPF